jgi:hypothetical protein
VFDDDPRVSGPRYLGMRIGRVVKRDAKRKRIKFIIEGFIEPESPWAYPLSAMGGGSSLVGALGLPRVGASVAVWFANGELEHPYYMPASWGDKSSPPEVEGREDAAVWSSENFVILMDDTSGKRKLRIMGRKNNPDANANTGTEDLLDLIEIDAEDSSITIRGAIALNLESIGIISINAPNVQIKGRKILPTEDPI